MIAAGAPQGGAPGWRPVNAEIGTKADAGRSEGYVQQAPSAPGRAPPRAGDLHAALTFQAFGYGLIYKSCHSNSMLNGVAIIELVIPARVARRHRHL